MSGSEHRNEVEATAEQSLHGATFVPDSPAALLAALEEAFDYRGDITLGLKDGRTLSGYLYNRAFDSATPYVDMLPPDGVRQRIVCDDIHFVRFSGRDMASGRSFEAWVKRWNEKQKALAEGRSFEDIEPRPTHLDES